MTGGPTPGPAGGRRPTQSQDSENLNITGTLPVRGSWLLVLLVTVPPVLYNTPAGPRARVLLLVAAGPSISHDMITRAVEQLEMFKLYSTV